MKTTHGFAHAFCVAPPVTPTKVMELCRPSDSHLEHVDFECLFSCLSLRLLLRVFGSLLLERRVIFTADKLRSVPAWRMNSPPSVASIITEALTKDIRCEETRGWSHSGPVVVFSAGRVDQRAIFKAWWFLGWGQFVCSTGSRAKKKHSPLPGMQEWVT